MGCDIHPYIEVLIEGKWICIGSPSHGRNYALFGKLSDVRGSPPDDCPDELVPHEGEVNMPSDADKGLQQAYEDGGMDYHSLTIMSLQMLRTFVKHYGRPTKRKWDKMTSKEQDAEYESASAAADWLDICEEYVGSGMAEDARMVMWYDN